MNRILNRVVLKSTAGVLGFDTGLSLALYTDEVTPALVATATEITAGSYRANFTSSEKWGYWYVGGVKKTEWGNVWLGSEPQAPAAYSVLSLNATGSERTAIALTASSFVTTDASGQLSTSTKLQLSSDSAAEYVALSGVATARGGIFRLGAYPLYLATLQMHRGNIGSSSVRWQIGMNGTAESGSNAGSDFDLWAYSDTGTLIGTALHVYRSSMLALFGGAVVSNSYLQGTYLELSSYLYLKSHVYVRNKADNGWLALLSRDTSGPEVRYIGAYLSQLTVNNGSASSAEQIVLRLGNFAGSASIQHDLITEDAADQSLIVRSNRWQGGMLWRRGGSGGYLKTAHLWSNESTDAWFELYTKGPTTQTVHSKLDSGTWTLTPPSGAAQIVMKVATYSTDGVAVQCDSSTGALVLNAIDSRAIIFKTANSQRAQIASGGQFSFATTSTTHGFTFGDGQTIGSATYQAGIFGGGFRLEHNSSLTNQSRLEIDNIMVRGSLRVHIFQKDIVRATNGYLFITDCTTLRSTVTIGPDPVALPVKEPVFQYDDVLWIKDIDESGGGLTVTSIFLLVTDDSDPDNPVVEYATGDYPATLKAGMTIVRIANGSNTSRQGTIFFDASGDNPPYMDIYDGRTGVSPVAPLVRLGKLSGITDSAFGGTLSGYGLYCQNGFFKGNVVVSSSVSLALASSTIAIGKVTGTAAGSIKIAQTGTASTSGIFAYGSSSEELFALRLNGTAQIAGWSFTDTKLSKDVDASNGVRLEASSSLAGLGVTNGGFNAVKVGRFTSGAPSLPRTNRVWTDGDFEGSWSGTPTGFSKSEGAHLTFDRSTFGNAAHGDYCLGIYPTTGTGGVYGSVSSSSFSLAALKGKTIRVSFWLSATEENEGETDLLRDCYVALHVDSIAVASQAFTFPTTAAGWTQKYVELDVPADCTTALLEFWFGDLAPTGRYWAGHWMDYITIETYDYTAVQISQDGLEVYFSPNIYFKLAGSAEAVLPSVKVKDFVQIGTKWKVREDAVTRTLDFYFDGDLKAQLSTTGVWSEGL